MECKKAAAPLDAPMKPPPLTLLALLLPACAAQVTHPTKSVAEMQMDIDFCTEAANRKYWMDPIAALYNAYDCLEARGYQRSKGDLSTKVERAMGEDRDRRGPPDASKPCTVPCRR